MTKEMQPHDAALEITAPDTIDRLAAALRANRYELDPEEQALVADAYALAVVDAESYQRGFDLLEDLAFLQERIKSDHDKFRKPLNFLIAVVREMEREVNGPITITREALGDAVVTWKREQDRKDREAAVARQQAADAAAQAAKAAKAETMQAMALQQTDPLLAAVIQREAEVIAETPVSAAPVKAETTVPKTGGHLRETWSAKVEDVKVLVGAWVAGKCHLPEQDIINGLQSFLNKQAVSFKQELSKAFPGVVGVSDQTPVTRRKKKP